ncbi:hypothetical protein FRB97_006001 [Tulasnella sp. 331]|nr:hypothetical protein FRB97_006001 [Tulasnella sp. 331]KAG8887819.1 hypothetical protein FRB98_009001 [Tulasnella sp. 332]
MASQQQQSQKDTTSCATSALYPSHAGMIKITTYAAPMDLLRDAGSALYRREKEANVLLPLVEKLLQQNKAINLAEAPLNDTQQSSASSNVPNFWLVLQSQSPSGSSSCQEAIDFVLSCTNGSMGAYPIFVWAARPIRTMAKEFIQVRMTYLAEHLLCNLPSSKRVFSIFAPTKVTQYFAAAWSALTGSVPVEDPYYHAVFASVTKQTLRLESPPTIIAPRGYALRRAVPGDEPGIAHLCYEFAAGSEPFILDMAGAHREAHLLVSQGQVYVCDVEGAIACMVALTRSSLNHAAITKVVTHPSYYSQGWAKRLVRDVCTRLLYDEQKTSVVLYVALGNVAAEKVYHNVGFSGLMGTPRDAETDDEWLELGFEKTDLGHW